MQVETVLAEILTFLAMHRPHQPWTFINKHFGTAVQQMGPGPVRPLTADTRC